MREKPEWERRRFLTLVFNLLIVEILFFFFFWRKEKGNGGGKGKGLHFVCQRWRSGIWGAGLAFGIVL